MSFRVTLDQWRVLQTIIDEGGFAQAAGVLHRSQSSVSYAAKKIQDTLGLKLLEIDGRKARLTPVGQLMLDRARGLLREAESLEQAARQLQQGWSPTISVAVENVLPAGLLMEVLQRFDECGKGTRIHLREEVLSGVTDALDNGLVELAISPSVPERYMYESLLDVEFLAVAHRDHELHQAQTAYGVEQLRDSVHIVIRDTGLRPVDAGWVQNENKWTVSSFATAIDLVKNGLGFAWLPRPHIEHLLVNQTLLPLNLRQGGSHSVSVNLIYAEEHEPGPAHQVFIDLLKETAQQYQTMNS